MSVDITLHCDQENCVQKIATGCTTITAAVRWAKDRGWRRTAGYDFCRGHNLSYKPHQPRQPR